MYCYLNYKDEKNGFIYLFTSSVNSVGNAIIQNFKNMLRKNSEKKQDSSEETKC